MALMNTTVTSVLETERDGQTETDRQRYKQTDMQTDHIICTCINDHVHVKSLVDYGNAKIT